ncbi:hypothetical protein, partial [Selenihalanaerobacter shriftii]
MNDKYNLILEKLYGVDCNKKPKEIIEELKDKITGEKSFKTDTYKDEENAGIFIKYISKDKENTITNLCIAAGLPNEEFDRAEKSYLSEIKDNRKDYKYILKGDLLGGALAQYAGIMAEGYIENHQIITYNSFGLGNLLEFKGNEFLGYEIGLLYYLNSIFYKDSKMTILRNELVYKGIIKDGNINDEFRRQGGQRLNAKRMQEVLIKIFNKILDLEEKEVKDLVEDSFNPLIIERKMRFIDNYRKYKERTQEEKSNIINYIMSDNIPSRLLKHVGFVYVVDDDLKSINRRLDDKTKKWIKKLEKDQLEYLLIHKFDLFDPFILDKESGNCESAINRLRKEPELGNMTNNISLDYLRSLVKDIIVDLHNKDKEFLKEVFKFTRRGRKQEVIKIVKDRLRHSLKLMKKLDMVDSSLQSFESRYLRENSDIFTENDRIYILAQPVLEQLERRMKYSEIQQLWNWELNSDNALLILGTKLEGDAELIEYHDTDESRKFNNEERRLKVQLEEPSQNRLYGSHKQRSNYRQELDNEYFVEDKEIYQFKNTHGLGFEILSQYTNPEWTIKLDAKDISGTYREVDKIKGKRKVGGEKYYGQNIVYKPSRYELVYLYGPNNEDKLIIDGFKNGDYGINLKDKVKENKDEKVPITYTPHRVRSKPFEFKILEKLEITKSIYDHTRVTIKGAIDEDNAKEYERKLDVEDPKLVMTYNNQDHKILFKGIIEAYDLEFKRHEYYLTIKAVSYSIFLKRARPNRIYQNLGTTYSQVLDKLMEDNPKFNIVFADDAQAQTPLTTKDYPLVLQYKESEWDFLKRISSYLNLPVIVDDTKDDQEGINILLGTHIGKAKELDNISGVEIKKTRRKNHKIHYYKVDCHEHFRSKEVFDIGKKVKYRLTNQEERTIDLVIIKNKIYVEEGVLCSDLTLVREEEINILQERR